LCGITIAVAIALLIGLHVEPKGSLARWSQSLSCSAWPHIWHWLRSPGRKGGATIIQLVGAVVTFGGLWTAWLRARHGVTIAGLAMQLWDWILKQFAKLFGWPRPMVVQPGGAHLKLYAETTAGGFVTFNVISSMSTEENLERLAQFVNNLSGKTIPQIERHIVNLRSDINKTRTHASDLASQTVAHFQERIDSLQQELDNKQVLDLRWAIYGLLITVIGIALSYGT
jgi:hypothetical protein